MRTGISITLKPGDRRRLAALARDRNAPQKHVWRAEIVLLSADGIGTHEIMRQTGKSKTCVWRWQERFMQAGYDGLLHDKTRPSRIPPLGSDIAERVVALTRTGPPVEATHWTATMMAKAVGISASSVQRIWRWHGLFNPILFVTPGTKAGVLSLLPVRPCVRGVWTRRPFRFCLAIRI
jgi:transposase